MQFRRGTIRGGEGTIRVPHVANYTSVKQIESNALNWRKNISQNQILNLEDDVCVEDMRPSSTELYWTITRQARWCRWGRRGSILTKKSVDLTPAKTEINFSSYIYFESSNFRSKYLPNYNRRARGILVCLPSKSFECVFFQNQIFPTSGKYN